MGASQGGLLFLDAAPLTKGPHAYCIQNCNFSMFHDLSICNFKRSPATNCTNKKIPMKLNRMKKTCAKTTKNMVIYATFKSRKFIFGQSRNLCLLCLALVPKVLHI